MMKITLRASGFLSMDNSFNKNPLRHLIYKAGAKTAPIHLMLMI